MSNLSKRNFEDRQKDLDDIKKVGLKNLKMKIYIADMILAIFLGVNNVDAQVLWGTTSQKQAIELLKSQGKLLPNVPTDYGHYGRNYANQQYYIYNTYPYGDFWGRYEVGNLKNVNGKNLEIDNDIDSLNFLVESVYKQNMNRIIPIIIDNPIDTSMSRGEYERIDWGESKDFTGAGLVSDVFSHGTGMSAVMISKKDNYNEEDSWNSGTEPRLIARRYVGVWPGKARLYVNSPALGGNVETKKALDDIYNEAKNNPDKKYILSCSRSGGDPATNIGFSTLGTLDNVIIFVARTTKAHENINDNYTANQSTIEVGYVQMPPVSINSSDGSFKVSFTENQKDRVVPMDSPQTGKMHGDGFCVLGETATSQSTAFMSGIAANIRNQNPNWTKDQVIAMLRRDVYKSSEYPDNAQGRNEWTGRGIVQPGKTMKENIFPEIKTSINKKDSKYYFNVSNRPADYTIEGEGVAKDDKGYYIDLSKVAPGKYTYTFFGHCTYEGKVYLFPINRQVEIIGLESPMISDLSGHRKRLNQNPSLNKIYFEYFRGQVTNYKPGYTVNLKFNDGTIIPNVPVDAQGRFNLANTTDYPIPYKDGDPDIKLTVELVDDKGNKSSVDVILTNAIVTAIEGISLDGGLDNIKLYPNPVDNILHIDLPSDVSEVSIKIYNSVGQLYSTPKLTSYNNSIDLSNLKVGMYFVTITDEKGRKRTDKIVKR